MSAPPVLLDTCALIWLGENETVSLEASEALDDCWREGIPVLVSPISAWELGLLTAKGRLSLSAPPSRWFANFVRRAQVTLTEATATALIEASYLPGEPPNDPADRMLLATARELGCRLLTRDGKLLAYARAGHVQAVAC